MPRRRRKEWLQIGSGQSYFNRSQFPLQCLVFISPLLVIYQIGALLHPWSIEQQTPQHVLAFVLMLRFFSYFGAIGNYMPLGAVVAILLCWHLARKDKWDFPPKLYGAMALESITWAIPVFVISLALQHNLAAADEGGGNVRGLPWQSEAVISIGAGVYEELLFRLVTITTLNLFLVDIAKMKLQQAIPIIILVSAVLFALYHGLGDNLLMLPRFFFLMAFGVYTAGIFIFRGFGIVVGCHAMYDLIVVAASHYRGH